MLHHNEIPANFTMTVINNKVMAADKIKYDSKAFQKSVGLNGVGTKAVNALSNYFKVTAFRKGKQKTAEFQNGVLLKEYKEKRSSS